MPRAKRPFTEEDRNRRDAIMAAAKVRGLTRRDLARFAGLQVGPASDMRLSRWVNGTQPMPDEMVAAMANGVNGQSPSVVGEDGTCPTPSVVLEDSLAEAEKLAGEGDPKELSELAKNHCRSAVGTLVRLMLCSTSESVKLRSAELLLEYGDGRAAPSVVDVADQSGGVYFIQQGLDGPIKIGFSNEVKKRIMDLQVANPHPLRLLRVVAGDMETEARLHATFYRFRIMGEWFRPVPEILEMALGGERQQEAANG